MYKQETAYEMRISDWSSDVCSSDLDDYFLSRSLPLLVGGATTSRVHTAVKIAPNYEGPVIYVPDASRSVGVATNLMSDQVDTYLAEVAEEYDLVRTRHANRKATPLVSLEQARADRPKTDWSSYTPPRPQFISRRRFKNKPERRRG